MGNENEPEEKYIEEKYIKGQSKPYTFEEMEIIEEQKKNVFKIEINFSFGTGFLCKIPFPDGYNFLPVIITNNHIINKKENFL